MKMLPGFPGVFIIWVSGVSDLMFRFFRYQWRVQAKEVTMKSTWMRRLLFLFIYLLIRLKKMFLLKPTDCASVVLAGSVRLTFSRIVLWLLGVCPIVFIKLRSVKIMIGCVQSWGSKDQVRIERCLFYYSWKITPQTKRVDCEGERALGVIVYRLWSNRLRIEGFNKSHYKKRTTTKCRHLVSKMRRSLSEGFLRGWKHQSSVYSWSDPKKGGIWRHKEE